MPDLAAEGKKALWQPLSTVDRRVLGVLGEKAKTTPDAYPMSLNALRTGCNQKNNRDPLMDLELDQVEESIDRLRQVGAAAVIEGSGRVAKYRHYLYEWLGVDKVEMAVMIELILRGPQTEGELRGRAARMEPIADVAALRPVLDSLRAKGLVISLTPEGRGHVVTHALFQPKELERQRAQFANHVPADSPEEAPPRVQPAAPSAPRPSVPAQVPPAAPRAAAVDDGQLAGLRREIAELRSTCAQLTGDLAEMREAWRRDHEELERLRSALGG
jgi:uncharacterized protein